MSHRIASGVLTCVLLIVVGLAPMAAADSHRSSGHGPFTREMARTMRDLAMRDRLPARASRLRAVGRPDPAEKPVEPAPSPEPAPPPKPPEPPPLRTQATHSASGQPRYVAGVEHLPLRLPPHVHTVGFHEAGSRALPMHPVGRPRINDNLPRLPSAPVSEGPEYVVMRTRNRWTPATSAIDMAMPFNHPVVSPVSGTVTSVSTYLLYRRVADNRVVIVPDSRPDLEVHLLHVNGVKVAAGTRVEAGKTTLALTARQLPFVSQVERYSGRMPHVHVEIRRR